MDETMTVPPSVEGETAGGGPAPKGERRPFSEMMRKVVLAGIGAAALAQDELEEFVEKLIERGELAEADGRKLMKDAQERRRKLFQEQTRKAEEAFERRIEAVLDRMNLPTRDEIAALNARIAELTQKVEELKRNG